MDLKHLVVFALLLVPLSFAIGGPNPRGGPAGSYGEVKAEWMGASMDNVICKTDFMKGALLSMMENVNGTGSLQENVDALESDVETLQGYSHGGDGAAYGDYLRGEYAEHMREARTAIMNARRGVKGPERERLRVDYEALLGEYRECDSETLGRFAEAKISSYEKALEKAQERADNLSAKGVDTSGLEALIEGARTEVIEPLKQAVDSAADSAGVHSAVRQYCLFNGCKDGLNYHFWARFEAEKLESIIDAVGPEAEAEGLDDELAEAQEDVDDAQESLDETGSSQYSEEDGQEALGKLKSASEKLKGVLSELRSD